MCIYELMNAREISTSIRTLPVIGLHALRQKYSGAWRAWIMMRHLDVSGSGVVKDDEARAFAASLGIPARRWKRWMQEALSEEFLKKITRHRDGRVEIVYQLVGVGRIARPLGCTTVGSRPVDIPVDLLIVEDCIAYVWAAFLATLPPDRPISRAAMRDITGIPERSQLRYEAECNIRVTPNYAVTTLPEEYLPGVQEFEIGHAFILRDPDTGKRVVAWRLPNSYLVLTPGIRTRRRGSTSRINRELKHSLSANVSRERDMVRAYHNSEASRKAAVSMMRRKDIRGEAYDRPRRLHTRRTCRKPHRANLYDVEEA